MGTEVLTCSVCLSVASGSSKTLNLSNKTSQLQFCCFFLENIFFILLKFNDSKYITTQFLSID